MLQAIGKEAHLRFLKTSRREIPSEHSWKLEDLLFAGKGKCLGLIHPSTYDGSLKMQLFLIHTSKIRTDSDS